MRTRLFCVLLLAGMPAMAEVALSSPGFEASPVDATGAIHEAWGTVGLSILEPAGATVSGQQYEASAVPIAVTTVSAGPITLTETAFRAPIFPSGADVLLARLSNTAQSANEVRIAVQVPDPMSIGQCVGMLNGQVVLGLPKNAAPIRKEKDWGCVGGVVPMPGWATPQGECDAAFKNISAGMGGVPIIYHFAVPKSAKRTVMLGFCESFHSTVGQRPLVAQVEGAAPQEVDPLAKWGRHVPGCLRFDACDKNEDGRLEVAVRPHPRANDHNPILNVIWVLPSDVPVDEQAVIRGELTPKAEYYVDVGGQKDQLLYEPGLLSYALKLQGGTSQELLFLLASPGSASVPNPETTSWTAESLRRAAEEVARDWRKIE